MEIKTTYTCFFKPFADFFFALTLLFLCSPLFVLVGFILLLHNQPVLFRQTRPGLNGKTFEIYKFASMKAGKQPVSFWFGRLLRRTSLDELPQLFNVLKGEMSFIGPRPLLIAYLEKYTPEQHKRHLVKPGITGWAQVNGRNNLPFNKKLDLDLYYVENLSCWLDLKIFFMTVSQIMRWKEADYHDVVALNLRSKQNEYLFPSFTSEEE